MTLDKMPTSPRRVASILRHPECPQEILWAYVMKGYAKEVLANINCPAEILDVMVPNKSYVINEMVLEHPNITPSIAKKIAASKDYFVRVKVAQKFPQVLRNPLEGLSPYDLAKVDAEPQDIIDFYHYTASLSEKASLLQNPNCPLSLIEDVLNHTTSARLVAAIVKNNNLTAELITKLFLRSQKILKSTPINFQREFYLTLLKHPSCTNAIALDLSMYHDSTINNAAFAALIAAREKGKSA
ncbi:hypothetical protein [Neomoorella thermoacetica]|uniref:hypothetical protein n=1 Tax=Neomoorella thermoacetica TaxID=1525 RepID=UPI001E30D67B|nr:hypothetical protein [Moorella thermoacetica]